MREVNALSLQITARTKTIEHSIYNQSGRISALNELMIAQARLIDELSRCQKDSVLNIKSVLLKHDDKLSELKELISAQNRLVSKTIDTSAQLGTSLAEQKIQLQSLLIVTEKQSKLIELLSSNQENNFGSLAELSAKQEQRINNLSSAIVEQVQIIQELNKSWQDKFEKISDFITDNNSQLQTLGETITAQSGMIESFRNDSTTAQNEQERKISSLSDAITAQSGMIENFRNDSTAAQNEQERKISSLSDAITAQSGMIESLRNDSTTAQNEQERKISSLSDAITAQSGMIENLRNDSTTAQNEQERKISSLSDAITAQSGMIESLRNDSTTAQNEQERKISSLSDAITAQSGMIENFRNDSASAKTEQEKKIIALQELVIRQSSQIDALKELNKSLITKIAEVGDLSRKSVDGMFAHLTPNSKIVYYTHWRERLFYANTFNFSVFTQDDFMDRTIRLLNGLDLESRQTVCMLLNRMRAIMEFKGEKISINMFTLEEQNFINSELAIFKKSITKLANNVYCYNGYLLPMNHFEYNVFRDEYGLRYIRDISFIKNKHIIDAGAFIGDSALVLSRYTDKLVHAFEPSPENYDLMLKTIELNSLKNVIPNQLALTSKDDSTCVINLGELKSSSSISINDGFNYVGSAEAKTITLDTYVDKNSLEIGLIKVDVEGAEQDFLKGALRTIKSQKPVLIISIYHNSSDFFDIKPMIEKLDLGYSFRIHHPVIGSVLTETVLIAEVVQK